MILCLFLTCKVFTQTDTLSKPKYVFLTEEQARANIKELIAYDGLKLISAKQEERITNLLAIVEQYKEVVNKKDEIIMYKDSIIHVQEKIINAKWVPKINGFAGIDFIGFNMNNPTFYFRSAIDFKRVNIGVQLNGRVTDQYNLPNFYATLRGEIKIF